MDATMNPIIDRALPLWAEPLPADDADARAAFAAVYTDPVMVNGVLTPVDDLVVRARMVQGALSDLRHELLAGVDGGDRCAFAFRLSGRHTGTLDTPLGPLAATGRQLTVAGMDTFVLRDGRVAEVWAVADLLGALAAAGALTAGAPPPTPEGARPGRDAEPGAGRTWP
jgi:predicted ester cyclase